MIDVEYTIEYMSAPLQRGFVQQGGVSLPDDDIGCFGGCCGQPIDTTSDFKLPNDPVSILKELKAIKKYMEEQIEIKRIETIAYNEFMEEYHQKMGDIIE